MFTLRVDDEISLSLIGHETAPALFEIIRREQDHLSQWLAWPIHTKRIDDYLEHVQRVGHAYAEGRGMACAFIFRMSRGLRRFQHDRSVAA